MLSCGSKYLPYSGRRYSVNVGGSIRDHNDKVLPEKWIDGERCVKLTWIDGDAYYSVAVLVIICFQPMYLPDHLWKEIEPLFFDEDPSNCTVDNLAYRFRCGLLPHEEAPTFFYIPGFTRYVIDRYGTMLNADNLKEKAWYTVRPDLLRNSKGGYAATRVTNEKGKSSVLFRHRALCLTFKPIETALDLYQLVVNHKDGIPGNDDLDNLEWATYAKNNKHAHVNGLTGGRRKSVLVKDLKTGEIKKFNTTRKLARYLKYPTTAPIRHRLRHKPNVLFDDYLQFKWDDGSPWPEVDIENSVPVKFTVGDTMAARNVFTGEITTFKTFDEGSALVNVDKQTIMIHIRDHQIMPFRGYNFAYYRKGRTWPKHTELHLKAYEAYPVRTPDPIIVTNINTGEEHTMLSRNELADFLNISQSYATQLVVNDWIYQDTYRFKYYPLRENIAVPSDWKV